MKQFFKNVLSGIEGVLIISLGTALLGLWAALRKSQKNLTDIKEELEKTKTANSDLTEVSELNFSYAIENARDSEATHKSVRISK